MVLDSVISSGFGVYDLNLPQFYRKLGTEEKRYFDAYLIF